jgi:hypothetical protein
MKHNHPTLSALRRLHSEIGGKIIDNRRQAKRPREDRKHVAAVIKMFSPGYDIRAIAARRQYKANPWFRRGTLFRSALDVMRRASEPLTVAEIVDRMPTTKGVTSARSDQIRGLQSAVLASVRNRDGKGRVQIADNRIPARWFLAKQVE